MPEHECEFTYAVIIKSYGNPSSLRYKVARRLAKVVKMAFGGNTEVHIGTKSGNNVTWSEEEEVWPSGES